MRAAGGDLFLKQTLIEGERPLPALKLRIERLPEPPGPHLHFVTSIPGFFSAFGFFAFNTRARAGSARILINPAASF